MGADTDSPVALVTGGAQRIGGAISRHLHAAGFDVMVHYRRSGHAAEALVAELGSARSDSAACVAADLMVDTETRGLVDAVRARFGRLDVLVNNASTYYPTPLAELEPRHLDELIGVNLRAPLLLSAAAAPMLTQARGAIVNIVDIYAERPLYAHSAYCAGKAGLVAVTQSLAAELGPAVRVNAVAPGAILWHDALSDPDAQADMVATTALERRGSAADIASGVLYLARDAAYVTGEVLKVDGGRSLAWPGPREPGLG